MEMLQGVQGLYVGPRVDQSALLSIGAQISPLEQQELPVGSKVQRGRAST